MHPQSIDVKNEVVDLDDDNFETLAVQSKKPVLVDFWADWCQPCHMMAPTVQRLAEEYGDRILVAKLDTDANPKTTQKYGIRGIPALMLFKNGRVAQKIVGVKPKEEIASIIENHL